MSDLISRQAAIDALKKISFSHWFECGEYLSEDTREIEIINSNKAFEAIEALPPAQPEQRWIPCSERLPDGKGYVLVTDYGETNIGRRFDKRWLDYFGDKMKDVTAWMPLPEPYKEEQE